MEPTAGSGSAQARAAREQGIAAELAASIRGGSAHVGVVGLGYVGLPLALAAADEGFRVTGFDRDGERVAALAGGETGLRHVPPTALRRHLETCRFAATADLDGLDAPDVLVLCVPTPLDGRGAPDLACVAAAAAAIAARLRPGQLVVLESTTWPGTTAEVLAPALARSGLVAGEDFFLAYSPERVSPGDDVPLRAIPKVVGADDPHSRALAAAFYRRLVDRVVPVSGSRAAEATKLLENVFRAVNIALVNELKMVYEQLGVDVWEVLDAAETKPYGFLRFDPGPGWGGHCIPVDPAYLAWKARDAGVAARFVELAGEVNAAMPRWVVARLERALAERGRALAGARVLVVGVAYKAGVEDVRESPALALLDELAGRGAEVGYHDPLVTRLPPPGGSRTAELHSEPLDEATLRSCDAVVVATAQHGVDFARLRRLAPLVVDTRGVYRDDGARADGAAEVVRA